MSDPSIGHDKSNEVDFDVTKPPKSITFVGLLDPSDKSGNRVNGYFHWRCQGCGACNRDVAVVELQQAFLSRWSCQGCGETTVVRFRSRANAEWIAAHTLAITGRALCQWSDGESDVASPATAARAQKAGNQHVFAWIAVPTLVALILLGLSDIRRPADSAAAPAWISEKPQASAALSRLVGKWTSADGKDLLCFVHVDAASLRGTYVHFPEGRRPGQRVRFEIIHEDPKGERLVIRQWSEDLKGAQAGTSGPTGALDASIYIPLRGRSLTWIDIQEGKPVLKVHHRVDDSAALNSPPT